MVSIKPPTGRPLRKRVSADEQWILVFSSPIVRTENRVYFHSEHDMHGIAPATAVGNKTAIQSAIQSLYEGHLSSTVATEATVQETSSEPWFPPLHQVTKPNLTTAEAAYYLNRKPQTMRVWACHEDGPIRPKRTNGRLDWQTTDVKRIAGVA